MEKVYDRAEIVRLYNLGHPQNRIAEQIGCTCSTVNKILKAEGFLRRNMARGESKIPILPEEIQWKREALRIGETIYSRCPRDEKGKVKCTVVEKYRWFCVVRDRKGREWSIRYVEMLVNERKRHDKDQ